jgi:hypothetical protein
MGAILDSKHMPLKLIILLLFSVSLHATIYQPIEIEKLMEEADAVVEGEITGKVFKKLPTGEVITEYSMKVSKSSGLPLKYLSNSSDLKIVVPGGRWQGHVYKIEGTPDLEKIKSTTLLLKKFEFGLAIASLGMGVFKFDKQNQIYINNVFEENTLISKLDKTKFEQIVSERFGESLTTITPDKHLTIASKVLESSKNRTPSSVVENNGDSKIEETGFGLILLILFVFIFIWRKTGRFVSED